MTATADTNINIELNKKGLLSPFFIEVIAMNEEKDVPITLGEKYMLTIREASIYFNIGVKKIRRLAEDNIGVFSIYSGNRYLIIRPKFEEHLCRISTI